MFNNYHDRLIFVEKMKSITLFIIVSLISILLILLMFSKINQDKICNEISYIEHTIDGEKEPRLKFMNESEIRSKIQTNGNDVFDSAEELTNVAINYWNEWKGYYNTGTDWKGYEVNTCNTTIPGLTQISFNNIYWQTLEINDKTEYYLYNAYYDNRGTVKMVRIIASQRPWSKSEVW